MRLHTTTATVIGLATITLLTLPGCSGGPSSPAITAQQKHATIADTPSTPLSSAALHERLLDDHDLGENYAPEPESDSGQDDVTVIGCLALAKLGGDAAAGGSLDFPRRAKVSFTYAGRSDSEVSEELYSDTATNLAQGTSRIFDAMTSCPSYQVVVGSTPIEMTTRKTTAPPLGDEQWSMRLTYTAGARETVMKETAVRTGTVIVLLSGSPGLVDAHIDKAVAKARSAE